MMRALLVTSLLAGVAGCASTPPIDDARSYTERREYLEQLDAWDLRGRIAIDTGEQAFQGRFRWQQAADTLDLSIRGPLGTGVLEITGPTGDLTVTARGESWQLADPETELSQLVGWWLPVESFGAWLLGIPDPSFPATTSLGSLDALRTLEQRLWRLSYESYQIADGTLLPERIDLRHRELELRVNVDSWRNLGND